MTAMSEAIERAKQIAKKVLGGQYDPLLACRELVDIREQLPVVTDEVMDVFVAVATEVDGLPIGPERAHWTTESLPWKQPTTGRRYVAKSRKLCGGSLR
jgi:hypothetical protein